MENRSLYFGLKIIIMLVLYRCVGLWFLFCKRMKMIGHRWYTLTICVLAMTIAFIAFQHYKYQQETTKKIGNIEKYVRILSKEFTDLKLELEEYEEPGIDVKVSKYESSLENNYKKGDIDNEEENPEEDPEEDLGDDKEEGEESDAEDDNANGESIKGLKVKGLQEVNISDIPTEDEIKDLLQNSIFTAGATVMMGGDAQFMFQSNIDTNLSDPVITEITDSLEATKAVEPTNAVETSDAKEIDIDVDIDGIVSNEEDFTKEKIQFKTVQELKDMIIAKSGKLNWKLKKKAELVEEVVRLHNIVS